MPEPVEFDFKPSGFNALSWSTDGEIAIAAGTDLMLLFPIVSASDAQKKASTNDHQDPSTRSSSPSSSSSPSDSDDSSLENEWDRISFEASSFHTEIWPAESLPITTTGFYIAKEQRESEVLALGWSPPGLADHGRCVLGVLTTNGFLSVWSPGKQPRSSLGWERIAIISYVLPLTDRPDVVLVDDQIRAFAWAPESVNGVEVARLALVTEENIYVVRFEVVRDGLVPRVEARLEIPKEQPARGIQEEADRHQFGMHLLWHAPEVEKRMAGGEGSDRTSNTSYLILSCHGWIRQVAVSLGTSSRNPSTQSHAPSAQSAATTFLSWLDDAITSCHGPITLSSGKLFAIQGDHILSLPYSPTTFPPPPEQISLTAWQGWDTPTSIAPFNPSIAICQPLSLISYLTPSAPNTCTPTLTPINQLRYSRLYSHLETCRQDWADTHDLDDRSTLRVFGMASYLDPGTDKRWLAALVQFYPTDQIQYKLKVNELSTLVFTHEDWEADRTAMNMRREPVFPWKSGRQRVGQEAVRTEIRKALIEARGGRMNVDVDTDVLKRVGMLQMLATLVLEAEEAQVRAALETLKMLDDGAWSKIYGTNLPTDLDNQPSRTLTGVQRANDLIRIIHAEPSIASHIETCQIANCGHSLLFADGRDTFGSSKCAGPGHVYSRCALTLLAIQQPYISKDCERCSRTFLDQDKVPGGLSVVKSLVERFSRCPFCEGRFVG